MGVVKGSDSAKEFTFPSVYSSSVRGAAQEVKTIFHKLLPTLEHQNDFFKTDWYCCPPFAACVRKDLQTIMKTF